jgi:hypothetical protein
VQNVEGRERARDIFGVPWENTRFMSSSRERVVVSSSINSYNIEGRGWLEGDIDG